MKRDYCCGILKAAVENYDFPFEWPTYLNSETHEMRSDKLSIRLNHETPGGSVSMIHVSHATIIYCPFCGTKLLS